MRKKIIVLSTGRAGSTFISHLISAQIEGQSLHQGRCSRTLNILGNVGLCFGMENSVKGLLRLILNCAGRMGSTTDPLLSCPLTLLFSQHSEIKYYKILHLVRDPRDFVSSFMNWRRQRLRRMVLHHWVPFWQPNPWGTRDVNLFRFLKMTKFEHFCWIWAFKNHLFEKRWINDLGAEYLMIRLEDIVGPTQSPEPGRQRLADFLNLPFLKEPDTWRNRESVNRSKNQQFTHWRKWNQNQARILERHCGRLMAKYGYGQEAAWKGLIKSK